MNQKVKIAAYVLVIALTIFFSYRFSQSYSNAMAEPRTRELPANSETPEDPSPEPSKTGAMMTDGACLFLSILLLGLLSAHDISRFFANRAEAFIFNDDGEAMRHPEYEQAEKLWADGHHLEAIQLMREHLKNNPRHQYVAIRIAEIYENELKNYVAAALEYEEVLKNRLDPERWGWAAIHLANIYSGKLGKSKQAEDLLRRISDEYSQTAAAKKARERLGLPEPKPEIPEDEIPASPPPNAPAESNLPKGFRPKK